MSSASIKKIIPCKKEQLVKMVLDIEKYPEFVPWCIEGKVYDKNESIENITIKLNHWLEEKIKKNPAQWIWSHNRWKL